MFVSMHDNVFVIMFHHTNLYIVDQFHGLDHFNTRGPTMSGSHRYLNATMSQSRRRSNRMLIGATVGWDTAGHGRVGYSDGRVGYSCRVGYDAGRWRLRHLALLCGAEDITMSTGLMIITILITTTTTTLITTAYRLLLTLSMPNASTHARIRTHTRKYVCIHTCMRMYEHLRRRAATESCLMIKPYKLQHIKHTV